VSVEIYLFIYLFVYFFAIWNDSRDPSEKVCWGYNMVVHGTALGCVSPVTPLRSNCTTTPCNFQLPRWEFVRCKVGSVVTCHGCSKQLGRYNATIYTTLSWSLTPYRQVMNSSGGGVISQTRYGLRYGSFLRSSWETKETDWVMRIDSGLAGHRRSTNA